MHRSVSTTMAVAACLALAAPAVQARDLTTAPRPEITAAAPLLPWAGTTTSDDGTWIHTDYVYDDFGADTCTCGQPNIAALAGTSGDYRYPAGDEFAGNAADVLEVRVTPEPLDAGGYDVTVVVALNTIVDPAVPALLVVADGTSRIVTDQTAGATVDAEANTITFALPDVGETLELFVGAGLHDGNGGLARGEAGNANFQPDAFTTGGFVADTDIAALFDVAFNTEAFEGRGGSWNEDAQSAALADGSALALTQTIDLAALVRGDGPVYEPGPGYHVALLTSGQSLGEGVDAGGFPQYLGTTQPYAVWIPDTDGAPIEKFFLSMHSLSAQHNQYVGGDAVGATYPRYYEQLGDETGAVIATPLGRGPDGWYENEGLIDTLEVWADMLRRFPTIDRDQVHVGGYSMGGYGTYRLTTLMPDAFASAEVMSGPMTNGIWAYPLPPEADGRTDRPDNTYHQLESTRHVPTSIKHGTNDELVPVAGVVHQTDRYEELGHRYRMDLFPGHGHFSMVFTDDWRMERDWINAHPFRTTDPHRVTLDIRPATWTETGGPTKSTPEEITAQLFALADEVGADLTGGYWIDGVVPADGDDVTAEIDLTAQPLADRAVVAVTDLPEPGVSDMQGPFVRRNQRWEPAVAVASNTLSGTLSGVAELTVDLDRTGLSDDPHIDIVTDGPVTLHLVRSSRPGFHRSVEGRVTDRSALDTRTRVVGVLWLVAGVIVLTSVAVDGTLASVLLVVGSVLMLGCGVASLVLACRR